MPEIHPTAIVDPSATLADDVVVGPWCLIEGQVTVGPGCRLYERVSLRGELTLGARNMLYPQVTLGFAGQDRGALSGELGAGIEVGDDNILREGVTIHQPTRDAPTRVGSRNFLMVNSHVGHDVQMGDDCTLVNGALLAGHVQLGDRVIISGNGGVHQFVRVGRLAIVGGISVMTQDMPPFTMSIFPRTVSALNIVGLRRGGMRDHIKPLQRAFTITYRQGRARPDAVEAIREELADDPLCQEFADFVAGPTLRGLASYKAAE